MEARGDIPNYVSLRVGWAMKEWQHEYLIEDIVAEVARCVEGIQHLKRLRIQYGILPDSEYDNLYGTREGYRNMMSVYVALAPHLTELWQHVAHTGSLRVAVDAMYTKYLPGQRPDVQWQHVKTYPAMKGMQGTRIRDSCVARMHPQ